MQAKCFVPLQMHTYTYIHMHHDLHIHIDTHLKMPGAECEVNSDYIYIYLIGYRSAGVCIYILISIYMYARVYVLQFCL